MTYLKYLEKLLLFEDGILEVYRDFGLPLVSSGLHHAVAVHAILVEVVAAEVALAEPAHHLHARVVCIELALHEHLGVLSGLGPQLDLTLVQRLKTRRQLRLALVTV